jgi:hypothetical protein
LIRHPVTRHGRSGGTCWRIPEKLGSIMKINVALLVLVCSAGLAIGQDPPAETDAKAGEESELAALAVKEVARRQRLPEKGPVITNTDLSRLLGPMKSRPAPEKVSEGVPGEEAGSAAAGENKPVISAEDEKEAYLDEIWDALETARQNVETASNSYMVLELRINNIRNRLYQEADPSRQQMLQKELNETVTDIRRAREVEAESRRELDLLKIEARRAGMLPGEIDDIVGTIPVTQSSATID